MAYMICCDLLDLPAALQPGDNISNQELQMVQVQAAGHARLKGQQGAAKVADALLILFSTELEGEWHTMPDLITLLTTQWFLPRFSSDGSNSSKPGWLQSLGKMAGDSAMRTAYRWSSAGLRHAALHYMLESCTKPDTPSDSDPHPGVNALRLLCTL
jgi:hypothetical protein